MYHMSYKDTSTGGIFIRIDDISWGGATFREASSMSLCLKELIYATSPHTALSIKNNAEEETDFCHLSFYGMVS